MSSASGVKQCAEGCLWECWLDHCNASLTFICVMPCFFHRTSTLLSETDKFEMLRLLQRRQKKEERPTKCFPNELLEPLCYELENSTCGKDRTCEQSQ